MARPGASAEKAAGGDSAGPELAMVAYPFRQGRVVPEWHEASVREVFHEPYRVIYEVIEDRIEILTLTHFRQELPPQPPGGSS